MTAGYVELHAKSFYSFGMGASHVHELLSRAVELGYPALALTDANLCGALEFARLAGSLGIQPITGGELTLMDGSRLVMLAKTREGYANISRLFTLANSVDRRKPRLDPATCGSTPAALSCSPAGAEGLSPGSCPTADVRRPGGFSGTTWSGTARTRCMWICSRTSSRGTRSATVSRRGLRKRLAFPLWRPTTLSTTCPGEVQATARPRRRRPQRHHRPGPALHQPQPPPASEVARADGPYLP